MQRDAVDNGCKTAPVTMQESTSTAAAGTDHSKGCRLPLARSGPGQNHLHRTVLGFRRLLERSVAEANGGEISPPQASRIRTACTAMRQSVRIERILADAGEPGQVTTETSSKAQDGATATTVRQTGLTHEQWLAYHTALLRAEEVRDRAIAG